MREILAEKVNVCHSLEASNKKLHWNNIFLETHFSLSLFNVGEFAQQRHESDCSHVEFERDEAHNLAEKALNSFVFKFSFFCIWLPNLRGSLSAVLRDSSLNLGSRILSKNFVCFYF